MLAQNLLLESCPLVRARSLSLLLTPLPSTAARALLPSCALLPRSAPPLLVGGRDRTAGLSLSITSTLLADTTSSCDELEPRSTCGTTVAFNFSSLLEPQRVDALA